MYLPKFKFKKDTAKAGEFIDKLGKSVAGNVIKDFLGRTFKGSSPSGINPDDALIPVKKEPPVDKKFASEINDPTYKDYQKGLFMRYFIKDSRNGKIIEVTKKTYIAEKKEGKVYRRLLKIEWYITGSKEDQLINNFLHPGLKSKNQDVITQSEKVLVGIGAQILKDPGQFILSKEQTTDIPKPKVPKLRENLFTNGGEFLNQRTGREYFGPYHIHPTEGAMIGKTHVLAQHDKLIPLPEGFIIPKKKPKLPIGELPPVRKSKPIDVPEKIIGFPMATDEVIDDEQRKKMKDAQDAADEKERYEEEQKETIEQLEEDRDTDRARIAELEQQIAQQNTGGSNYG